MINVPLLRKALEFITEHPGEWQQQEWATRTACGTACCLAGTVAVTLLGHEPLWGSAGQASFVKTPNGILSISAVASEALGLAGDAASSLFQGTNSLARLWHLAEYFTQGEIQVPDPVRITGFKDVIQKELQ